MDSYVGFRQSTRVAIKKSLFETSHVPEEPKKSAKPDSKRVVKNLDKIDGQKVLEKRKKQQKKNRGSNKKRAVGKAAPEHEESMIEPEAATIASSLENVAVEDCASMYAAKDCATMHSTSTIVSECSEAIDSKQDIVPNELQEASGHDEAQFRTDFEELNLEVTKSDDESQTREQTKDLQAISDTDHSFTERILALVAPFPQKMNNLLIPSRKPTQKFAPVRDSKDLKICSWFIDGILTEKAIHYIETNEWDIFCLQGLYCSNEDQLPRNLKRISQNFECTWKFSKSCSGLGVMSRVKADFEISNDDFGDDPVLAMEYKNFFLVCVAAPSTGFGLIHLSKKLNWFNSLIGHVAYMADDKPVIIAGNLGTAHQAIDIENPKLHARSTFTKEESESMSVLLDHQFTDSFRCLNNDKAAFTAFTAHPVWGRLEGTGLRLDYFLVSNIIQNVIKSSVIRSELDELSHSPIELLIELE